MKKLISFEEAKKYPKTFIKDKTWVYDSSGNLLIFEKEYDNHSDFWKAENLGYDINKVGKHLNLEELIELANKNKAVLLHNQSIKPAKTILYRRLTDVLGVLMLEDLGEHNECPNFLTRPFQEILMEGSVMLTKDEWKNFEKQRRSTK